MVKPRTAAEIPEIAAIADTKTPEPRLPKELQALAFPVAKLTPDPRNARKHGERNKAAVRASLLEFGWRSVIVARKKDRVVLAGNARLEAAIAMGWKQAPVLWVDDDQARSMAYAIADNRTAELAEWDDEQLLANLRELQREDGLIDAVGFNEFEIAEMLGAEEQSAAGSDDLPPEPTKASTKQGDLWILGNHRLLCGDSTNIAHVQVLMDGNRAALCATDPPYCIDYTGERPNGSGKDWTENYREIDIVDPNAFFQSVFTNVLAVLDRRSAIYCWHAAKRAGDIVRIWRELGILDHQQIVWVKPTPVFGRVYWHFRHEPCLMGWKQGDKPENPTSHEHDSVWEIDWNRTEGDEPVPAKKGKRRKAKPADDEQAPERTVHDSVWRVDWEGKSRIIGNEHPTQKPVEIFARPMRAHTRPGAICFEPFSGSGSQIIAAEMTGRRCFAMELSPVFVEVAVARWEAFTGKKARRQKVSLGA